MKRNLSCAALLVAITMAASAMATSPPISIARPALVPSPPRLVVAGAEVPIRLESVAVTTQVSGRLAQTSVELVFFNPNNRQLEGELQFPLLDGQEITGFAMDFNGRLREAVPVEKARGQAVFEDITRARVDPALAEKTVGNNFKLRVYPLFARARKIVVVRYQEALSERDGALAYRLPLAFGERVARFTWAGHVASTAMPRHVRGPLGDMTITRTVAGFELQAEKSDVQLAGVIELAIPPQGAALATTQEFDGETYFYVEPVIAAMRAGQRQAPQRVAIYWDASGSGAERDHAREFEVLNVYFRRFPNIDVTLVPFRDTAASARSFAVRQGDWAALRRAIETLDYDGATAFAPLAKANGVDEVLLFSDGLANYGDSALPKSTIPIYAINAATRSDAAFLRALAEQSGGRYVDAGSLGSAGAAAILLAAAPRISIESSSGVADALLASPYARNGRMQLAGRLTEAEGSVVLRIDAPGARPSRLTVPLRHSGAGGFAAQRWATLKVAALEADYDLNRAQVQRLGKRFSLITRGTSLIILDTAQDYARFDIEPPLELRAEYQRLRAAGIRSREADRSAHLERVVRQFQEKQTWWEREFPKGKKQAAAISEREQSGTVSTRGGNVGAPGELNDATSRRDEQRERAPQLSAPATAQARPAPAAPMVAQRSSNNAKSAEATSSPTLAIRLQPWSPDSAYARRMREAEPADLYRIYLDERASNQNSTGFFLDVADLLLAKGDTALALRVLSNLAEMNLENRHILRILGYRLMQAGQAQAALPVFKRVRDLSPDEPQSYRDLGLAYAAAGQPQKAADALAEVVTRPWHGRFPDVELIALAELNAIAAQSPQQLDLGRIDARLLRNLPLDVRAVLAWDADNTDIDLHVTDPNGETAYYGNRLTFQGGRMSADFTGGYGPEEFSLKRAKPGKYRVEAQFYGHRQQVVADATTLMLRLTTGFGTTTAREQLVTLRLKGNGSKVFVGEFEAGGS